jgi:hypothetical protein
VHLPVSVTQLNGIPRQYLSTLPTQDAATNTLLSATVPNPFLGLNTNSSVSSSKTATTAQILSHYPQFPVGDTSSGWTGSGGILEDNLNVGASYFESINVRLQKRLSNGLQLVGNYIHSKLIERDDWLNASDPRPEKRISPFDHPNRFVVAAVYELPFGRGGSRLKQAIIGGWRVTSFYTIQTGQPFIWVNGSSTTPGDYVFYGGPGQLTVDNRNANSPAFNTALFNATQTFQYHLRTFSTTFPNLRQDGLNELDSSVLKNFRITERAQFQFRFEVFNLVNHPTFGPPNTQVSSGSSFGTITTQSNRPRTIQVGAKIIF